MKEIFNIFQKKEIIEKQIEKISIIADYREKNSIVFSELISLGINVEFQNLPVADYIVKGIAIERKTVHDFLSSMINKRIIRQLNELQQYEKKMLIIEGIETHSLYEDNNEGIHSNSVRGFLLSIILNYNVPIIFSKNEEDTAKFINILAKKNKVESEIRAKKKSLSIKEQLQYILEGFPGVGPKSAKKLLEEFKSLEKIINASDEELEKKIGKKSNSIIKLRKEKY